LAAITKITLKKETYYYITKMDSCGVVLAHLHNSIVFVEEFFCILNWRRACGDGLELGSLREPRVRLALWHIVARGFHLGGEICGKTMKS